MAFSYRVSLQVRHPNADPVDIVSGLGLRPKHQWKVGDPRTTPKGTRLLGTRDQTYCVFDIDRGEDGALAQCLRRAVDDLIPKSAFIQSLRSTGGVLNFHVTWTVGGRGEVFDCTLLRDIAFLGIDLGIEPLRAHQF